MENIFLYIQYTIIALFLISFAKKCLNHWKVKLLCIFGILIGADVTFTGGQQTYKWVFIDLIWLGNLIVCGIILYHHLI